LHTKGETNIGVCIEDDQKQFDSFKEGVVDLFSVKERAIKLATHAAVTLLSIDQVIFNSFCRLL
jgi:chaperonin GroEL (HSP60 family)